MNNLDKEVTLLKIANKTNELSTKLDNNFIPGNSILHVELDGSGDFTSLQDAISYLQSKWSNGKVIIQLGKGTFDISTNILIRLTTDCDIPFLLIFGVSKNETILQVNANVTSGWAITVGRASNIMFKNLSMIANGVQNTNEQKAWGLIQFLEGSNGYIENCSFSSVDTCILGQGTSRVLFSLINDFSNFKSAITAEAGYITSVWNSTFNFTNGTYGLVATYGGQIHITGNNTINCTSCTKSNLSNGVCGAGGYITW